MTVEPLRSRRDLRERHPGLKGDPSFLRQNDYRAESLDRCDDHFKQPADLRRLTRKMRFQVVATAEV
jgi:hypothetical protein